MKHPLKKALKTADMKFKWGGRGNVDVYYRTPEMTMFRAFDSDKDAARVAKDLEGVDDFDNEDIYRISQQVAWTWNQETKENDYSLLK